MSVRIKHRRKPPNGFAPFLILCACGIEYWSSNERSESCLKCALDIRPATPGQRKAEP